METPTPENATDATPWTFGEEARLENIQRTSKGIRARQWSGLSVWCFTLGLLSIVLLPLLGATVCLLLGTIALALGWSHHGKTGRTLCGIGIALGLIGTVTSAMGILAVVSIKVNPKVNWL
ncbi:hypothetical protein BH11PLA2_BH11PLA2_12540 [soil metagenome]